MTLVAEARAGFWRDVIPQASPGVAEAPAVAHLRRWLAAEGRALAAARRLLAVERAELAAAREGLHLWADEATYEQLVGAFCAAVGEAGAARTDFRAARSRELVWGEVRR